MMRVALLASCDAMARDVASLAIGCDAAGVVEVRHELVTRPGGSQYVHATAHDLGGLVYGEQVDLDHGCVSCTVREGLVPVLAWLADQRRWQNALVTLPVTAPPDAVAWQLDQAVEQGQLDDVCLGQVLTVVDHTRLVEDLMGDDLLSERGMQLSDHDVRAVGEALALQLDASDVVVGLEPPDEQADALLDHVLAPGIERVRALGDLDVASLFACRHDVCAAQHRMSPLHRRPRTRVDREGVWTLELHSSRAFHPQRLLDQIELLGSGRLRSRGCFWLPSRPSSVCVWDGSGGQLSIGEAGSWDGLRPCTRLVVTGVDGDDRDRVQRAFTDVLLTTHEEPTAVRRWAGRPDGLEPWLGEADEAA